MNILASLTLRSAGSFLVEEMASGSSTRKRLFEEDEFENVSEMHQSKCAKVHAFIASLSPMKTNESGTTKYFMEN